MSSKCRTWMGRTLMDGGSVLSTRVATGGMMVIAMEIAMVLHCAFKPLGKALRYHAIFLTTLEQQAKLEPNRPQSQ